MIVDLPSTSTRAVVRHLIDLRDQVGAMAMGRVLTLVVPVDEAHADAAIRTANDATRQHPARIIVVVSGNPRGAGRLDAQIRVGGDAGASEIVVLRLYGSLVPHDAAVVTPLLLPDSPVVVWWPAECPADVAATALGRMAQRRITDAARADKPATQLRRRARSYRAGDTDLAWTRLTRWRALLASSLEGEPYEPVDAVTVTAEADSPSAELLAGWLAHALHTPVTRVRSQAGTRLVSVRMERASGPIDLVRAEDGTDTATIAQAGRPPRLVALHSPGDPETLAEELRRLDADEIYAAALTLGLPEVRRGGTRSEATRAGRAPAGPAEVPGADRRTVSSRALARVTPDEGPVDDARLDAHVHAALQEAQGTNGHGSQVRVLPAKEDVARAVVDDLVDRVEAAVADRGRADVALTGGSMGTAVMAELAARAGSLERSTWRRVHLWWGDERFVPEGDPERNDAQADEAGLGVLPVLVKHVHRVPAARRDREVTPDAVEAAAARYAVELASAAGTGSTTVGGTDRTTHDDDATLAVPAFDVVMLGVGPDAHVASLFPGHEAVRLTSRATAAVTSSPKPPPARVTLTVPAIGRAEAVWLVVSGSDKAAAVEAARGAHDDPALPASCVRGRSETVWWLDEAAAGR